MPDSYLHKLNLDRKFWINLSRVSKSVADPDPRIRMDPDPIVRGIDSDPDPSIIKQK
jgi:hypothetical protein